MSKSRVRSSHKKTRWALIIILIVATTFTYVGYKYFTGSWLRPQSAGIFVLDQPAITYGRANVQGTIRKEFLTPEKATFIIITDEGMAIPLDIIGIDHLLGFRVAVSGIRLPVDPGTAMRDVLKVSTITLEVPE